MKYTKSELATLLQTQLRQALGAPGSDISDERLRNLQFYKAEAIGELAASSIPDRSSIVTSDVADTVEWMLPSLLRVFATSQDSMECEAKRPEMTQTAKLCGEYLRQIFWKRNHGFTVLQQWFKDALLQKVGFLRVFWEEEMVDSEESYSGLLLEQVEELLKDPAVELVEKAERAPEMIQGQPVELWDVTIKRTETVGCCKVLPCAPEEMRIHRDARYGQEMPFIAHVRRRRRADLEADGYDLSDVSASDTWSSEDVERHERDGWTRTEDEGELEEFECSDCFIRLDQDNDGIPEWRHVFMIGETVMTDEKADDHDFVYFCPIPMPHTFFGLCPADQAIGPQRLSTSLVRAMLDNTYMLVNQRVGVIEGQVNLDDVMNSRPGGLVRMKNPNAIFPIVQPGIGQDAYQMVEWGNQWRENRTGFTRNSQGLKADTLNDQTATGTLALIEKGDQRIELIARVAADSVRILFEKILKCVCKYQNKADQVELFGQWIQIDPREWANAYRISVNVGLGTGSKDRQAQVLMQLGAMQNALIQQGIVAPQAAITLATKYADAAGLTAPEQYFPPAPPRPPQPPEAVIKAQADQQIQQVKLQADAQIEQMRTQSQAQLERERMAMQQQTDIVRQQAEAEQQRMKIEQEAQLAAVKLQYERQDRAEEMAFQRWKAELDAATKIEAANISSKAKVANEATAAATGEIQREIN